MTHTQTGLASYVKCCLGVSSFAPLSQKCQLLLQKDSQAQSTQKTCYSRVRDIGWLRLSWAGGGTL